MVISSGESPRIVRALLPNSAYLLVDRLSEYSNHPQTITDMVSGRFCTRAVVLLMYRMEVIPVYPRCLCVGYLHLDRLSFQYDKDKR